ncbi:hypothetical protein QTP86_031236, partial [Hemibagrus guttatus]
MEPAIVIPKEATKWDIRQKVWDYIETKDLANFPRPVHHRIPNFKAASAACDQLPVLQEFRSSSAVKVNPDKPQERARFHVLHGAQGACGKMVGFDFFTKCSEVKVDPDKPLEGARLAALQAGKTLLVPTPRLRTGLFNRIVPPQRATKEDLRVCSTSQGVKEFSVPVGLDSRVHVDLVVVGSVAVSEKGYRIGKGEGFADMEYAMMVSMGAVNESTVLVTVVHDCQVVDIPEGLTESHDLTVDYILTPSRIIKTECKISKPQGIIWSKLDAEMLEKIPILKKLRASEQKAGKDVRLKVSSAENVKTKQEQKPKPEPKPCPASEPDPRQDGGLQLPGSGEEPDVGRERSQAPVNTLYLGSLPAGLRVSELKGFLRERDAVPVRLTWQGAQRRAFLCYADERASDQALDALKGLSVNGHVLHVERAKNQKSFPRPGASKNLARTNLKENLRLQHPPQPASVASQRRGHKLALSADLSLFFLNFFKATNRRGMDSTRSPKVCCCIWHQDASSRSFKSCKFRGEASMDRTCLSSTSHRYSIGLRSGEFGGQHLKLVVVVIKPFLKHFCFVARCIILLKEETAIREYSFNERVYMVCNNAQVGGTCQSNIHMDGRTQGFPAEHYPKHDAAFAGSPSSHSASWCHVFP